MLRSNWDVMCAFIACMMLLGATTAKADVVASARGTISIAYAYAEYGGGDVIFRISPTTGITECDGFWLRPSDPGFHSTLAILMNAMKANQSMVVFMNRSLKWSGSGVPFCLLYGIAP